MNKFKRLLAGIISAVTVIGSVVTVHATTKTLSGTVTETYASALFIYGKVGNTLKVKVEFSETHSTTNQVYKSSFNGYSFGAYDRVSACKTADEGYKYDWIRVTGFCNGNTDSVLGKIYP